MTDSKMYTSKLNKPIKSTNKSIYAVSDVHSEFYADATEVFDIIPWTDADYLVLAGDIGNPNEPAKLQVYKQFLTLCKDKYKEIILVPGNHEYYDCDYNRQSSKNILKKMCNELNIHLLDRESKIIDGIKFIGATLWSLIDKPSIDSIADFKYDVFDSQVSYVCEFVDDFRFIKNELDKTVNDTMPVIVVTHHLPSSTLVHSKYRNSTSNSAFCTNILDRLYLDKVKYWFCGHTHEYMQSNYGRTTLIVNPVGYPQETRSTKLSSKRHKVKICL